MTRYILHATQSRVLDDQHIQRFMHFGPFVKKQNDKKFVILNVRLLPCYN